MTETQLRNNIELETQLIYKTTQELLTIYRTLNYQPYKYEIDSVGKIYTDQFKLFNGGERTYVNKKGLVKDIMIDASFAELKRLYKDFLRRK